MTVRLLCVGDIHLGKHPTRMPDWLGDEPSLLGPEAALHRSVDEAIQRRVHAVLFAGDVVERIEERFRAFGALSDAAERLSGAGIRVVAVVGNHDVEALPRLAARVPQVELLGMGDERWERTRIEGDEGTNVDVWGWSFREKIERDDPLRTFPRGDARRGSTPTIGLLHTDLDATSSRHAPTRSADLASVGLDAWLLGHVHRPGALSAAAPIGYLGSVAATDPGEPGPHGPWSVEVDARGVRRFEHVPVSSVRYDSIDLDVAGLERAEGLADTLAARLEGETLPAWVDARVDELEHVRALALRVRLVGETDHAAAAIDAARELMGQQLATRGLAAFVETFVDATRPAVDVAALATEPGYPGLVARRLLALEEGGDASRALVARAREAIDRDLAQQRAWTALGERAPLTDERIRERLAASARRTLETMRADAQERSS